MDGLGFEVRHCPDCDLSIFCRFKSQKIKARAFFALSQDISINVQERSGVFYRRRDTYIVLPISGALLLLFSLKNIVDALLGRHESQIGHSVD